MTDIANELREANQYIVNSNGIYGGRMDLFDRAADEIECLRAKIEATSQVAGKASIEGVTLSQIKGGYRPSDSEVLGKYNGESNV